MIRRRIGTPIPSSTEPTCVITDLGTAYVKWPANTQGTAALSSELIGTALATWFGLETFRFSVFQAAPVDAFPDSTDESLVPVFATEEVLGNPWEGSADLLLRIENPEDISWLVVFDTFACNFDRFCPLPDRGEPRNHSNCRNVFLSNAEQPGRFRLRVYDHTHCEYGTMDAGGGANWERKVEDPKVYGCFPAFKPYLDRDQVKMAAAKLRTLDRPTVEAITEMVPQSWIQNPDSPKNWVEFITRRAVYVSQAIELKLFPQQELNYDDPQ